MQTEKVKVVKFNQYREFKNDGTIEYRDQHNRRYFVQAPSQKDPKIYAEYPKPITAHQSFRDDITLIGIELEIVESFKPKPSETLF